MAYHPIYDCSVDLCALDEPGAWMDFMRSLFDRKLVLVGFKVDGGAGFPEFVIRGTRKQILSWLLEWYDVDRNIVDVDEDASEADVWAAYNDVEGMIKFVA